MSMKTKLVLAAALLAMAPAANAATVVATFTSGIGGTVGRNILTGPGAPQMNSTQTADRFSMDRTGGSFANTLVGDGSTDFYAWCIEPRETITQGQSVTYTVLPLSQAATNLGGIGTAKAYQVRELFGRFNPSFATPLTALQAGAFQIALWEIVRETAGNPLDLSTGNVYFDAGSDSLPGMLALASSYVTALDGTGPMAKNLKVLSNGTFGVQGSGGQDLVVQSVPEPESWVMLIMGFGLIGAASRRRAKAVAA
jgi:hypothetical protein